MRKSPTKHLYHSPCHAGGVSGGGDSSSNDESGVVSRGGTCAENRPSQLVQLQEQFYNYASIDDLVEKLKLSPKLGALIYNYWKLKRKVVIKWGGGVRQISGIVFEGSWHLVFRSGDLHSFIC